MPPTPDAPTPDTPASGPPASRSPSGGAQGSGSFAERVYAVVRRIPSGRVTSYGSVAALVGAPRAARGVGAALNRLLPGDDDVPWWRVVNRRGILTIPPDLGLRALQRTLLESEGVSFLASDGLSPDRVDLDAHGWGGPDGAEEDP